MNTEQFKLLKMIDNCDKDKTDFLTKIVLGASKSYDHAKQQNAQRIQGEINLESVTENRAKSYGKKMVSECREMWGEMGTSVYHELRDSKTVKDFDWENYRR